MPKPPTPITDDMVERGARVLAAQFDHAYSEAEEFYTPAYWNHLARNMLNGALNGVTEAHEVWGPDHPSYDEMGQ